ncbi:MAG: PKD domain-containing protein [Lewinellaceae bacterium]|nr:PKD domain-containing protein [Lewinellaceae bacterium]
MRVTDEQSLESYCFVSLNIEDNSPPTALCQPSMTLFPDETGIVSITPADLDNGSFDNCGITSRSISQTTFTCSDIGTYSVTLTVGDAEENFSTCTTEVMVKAYELDCPGDFCVTIPTGETEYLRRSFFFR